MNYRYGYNFDRESFERELGSILDESVYNFSSDNVNIFKFNIDSSSSMEDDGKYRDVIAGLEMYKKSFMHKICKKVTKTIIFIKSIA